MARLNSARRERVIVSAALRLANEHGLAYLTAERVAAACRVKTSEATVRRYFHTVDQLRLRVARRSWCRSKAVSRSARHGVNLSVLDIAAIHRVRWR
jgi:AcrR family transcriptional regulator